MKIPREEFSERISRIRREMEKEDIDAVLVYGDEYRREYIRYVSNYWPIFERAMLVIPKDGDPILLGAPECEKVAREMSAWPDIRNIKDFTCVTVPDEIDYSLAEFSSFSSVYREVNSRSQLKRVGLVGVNAIPAPVLESIKSAFEGVEIVNFESVLNRMRLIKTPQEIKCLRKAAEFADKGFQALMEACVPGASELAAAAAGEYGARKAGAEYVPFVVFGSGERTHTIVGRPTEKIIEDGDMIMAALAVQFEGYIASAEFPFVAGRMSKGQKDLINALIVAEDRALNLLKAGTPAREFVRKVRQYFRDNNLSQYDVYPPLHGCGYAEAESPYPDENSELVFEENMTVNTDISLFGHPAGSNRIEEGFVITKEGPEPMSKLVRKLCSEWLSRG
ncbi:MAG: Xaa-Pro peptidase family protein [Candidatus Omnitrophota bacterium]